MWAGPNAVMAFARQGYQRWKINPKDLLEILGFSGFWKLAAQYWKMGLAEMYHDYVKAAYVKELQRYIPELQSDDIVPGNSWVRAQALAKDGRLIDDLLIYHGQNTVHVVNAPSPAATSSLVLAQMIANVAQRSFTMIQ